MMTKPNWIDLVKEFNAAYGVEAPAPYDEDSLNLQWRLVDEEMQELCDASSDIKFLDAIGDIIYVLIGLALKCGYDLDGAFREIHRSNMSKLGTDGKPIYRDDGKILKGPDYTPPDLEPFIN